MPVIVAAPLKVTRKQRLELERMARSSVLPHRMVVQAGALLLAADGVASEQITRECATNPDTVARIWRARNLRPWKVEPFKLAADPDFEPGDCFSCWPAVTRLTTS
jgi:hypothetical protein